MARCLHLKHAAKIIRFCEQTKQMRIFYSHLSIKIRL
nr:MAG TPA: hypothetical protein [Caudoviricetes sp.]